MRLAQTQVWPMLRNFETIAPSTAASRSASSNTMNGALPPSSSPTFFTVPARLAHQELADLGRAGEADEAHRRMFAERLADRRRVAGDDVEHAGRQAGALRQFAERQRRQRRLAARA